MRLLAHCFWPLEPEKLRTKSKDMQRDDTSLFFCVVNEKENEPSASGCHSDDNSDNGRGFMLFNSFEFLVFLPIVFIVEFFAYISFFPQLVADPIERATNLLRFIVISLAILTSPSAPPVYLASA